MFSTFFLDLPPLQTAAGSIDLPGSKSISNRVLLLAALSSGTTTVHDLLASDDTRVMLDALRQLGCEVQEDASQARITGLGGRPPASCAPIFLGNAGTAMRPLTAALAVLGVRVPVPNSFGRLIVTNVDAELVRIVEAKEATPSELAIDFVNSGVMAFDGKGMFDLIAKIGNANAKGEYYLTDAVEIAQPWPTKLASRTMPSSTCT